MFYIIVKLKICYPKGSSPLSQSQLGVKEKERESARSWLVHGAICDWMRRSFLAGATVIITFNCIFRYMLFYIFNSLFYISAADDVDRMRED
jgi:hypothetical protein